MNETEIREKVWSFLKESFLYMRPDFRVDPDESLLRAGVIDSLGVMEVIGFVEDLAGIQVAEDEITEANFGTLNAIARYIASKAVSQAS
jgi:acyl carrier protein